MIERFKETYIHKSVTFRKLPADLQSAIMQRIIFGFFMGILVLALGICSKNITTFLFSLFFILALTIICIFPYYLATRNLLVQISGLCTDKNVYRFLNNKTYQIYLITSESATRIKVNVKKGLFDNIRNDVAVNVYVVPKNIRQDSGGLYTIDAPLFVTIKNTQN